MNEILTDSYETCQREMKHFEKDGEKRQQMTREKGIQKRNAVIQRRR